MTEPKAQSQEPTMEEILASIRRIISENDDPSAAAKAPPGKGAGANQTIAADGVLELTDFAQPRGLRRPIDDFFVSLAADQQANAALAELAGADIELEGAEPEELRRFHAERACCLKDLMAIIPDSLS